MTDTITVVGNIATHPEQRTAGTVGVTSFRVATTERRPDAQGVWADAHTNYYTVSAYRALGENSFLSLRRGDRVIVAGRLRVREWTAADGAKGRSVDIDADMVGHDLRFGTTVFHRGARSDGAASGEQPTRDTEWATTAPGDGWAAPGVEATEAGRVSAETPGAATDEANRNGSDGETSGAERVPVLAGADTPF